MIVKLVPFKHLCELEVFEINGMKADYEDFGVKGDISPETAEEYCCGDMRFNGWDIHMPEQREFLYKAQNKYKLTLSEYIEIVIMLDKALSFGCCGWCS